MIDKIVSRAPARVCLFGDHQDYLSLPIIATTIDRTIEVSAIRNNSRYFKIFKKDLGEQDDINIDNEINPNETDFLKIAIRVLRDYNCIPDKGYDIIISSNILSGYSAYLLGADGCYFGIELGFVNKNYIAKFPYGYIPHPMILSQCIALYFMNYNSNFYNNWPYLSYMHILFYIVHMFQEHFNIYINNKLPI